MSATAEEADGVEIRDFFVSYTQSDKAWALWIANVLKSNGYTVYCQALDIGPGDNFLEKMNEFLENSRNFIAVWSENYSGSWYCMREIEAAFKACHEKRMSCLLPVRVDRHPMKLLYSALVHVDLSDMGAASEAALMEAVRYAVPRPVASTPDNAPLIAQTTPDNAPEEDAETLYQRGEDYFWGRNVLQQDYAKAREYWEQAATKGNEDVLHMLSWLYQNGLGGSTNYTKVRNYWEQAAAQGNATALCNLGYLYWNGLGVSVDYAKARDYYEQAAAKGYVSGLWNLGILYEYGQGVSVNYAKALEYYQQAADAGYWLAPAKVEKLRKKLGR